MVKQNPDSQDVIVACAAFRAARMSVTTPRLAVWIVVKHAAAPLLVTDIARGLEEQGHRVPLSSVYSALKRTNAAGLLAGIVFSDGKIRFGLANRPAHHRVNCVETGTEHWLDDGDFAQHVAALCRLHGFELHDYTLSIQARRVTDSSAKRGAARRLSRPTQGKGQVLLLQGDVNHEDEVSAMLSDTG